MSVTAASKSVATPESPWLGLRSFTEDAQPYFFGRREELNDLYERIVDKPLTILFGQSGLGKSSLLQAALIPQLRDSGFLPVLVRLDHDREAPTLDDQLLEHLRACLDSAGFGAQVDTLGDAMSQARETLDHAALLWLLFHDPAYGFIPRRGDAGEHPRPVFLIDQFEEIFTLGERVERRATCAAFLETLSAIVENRPPASLRAVLETDDDLAERLDYRAHHVRVLLSLREDFLHLLERWRRSMPSLMENRLELRMLSGPQAFQAVVGPGRLRPGQPPIIPDPVGEAIVRFVAGADAERPLEDIDAVPPLLSLVCSELNAQRLAAGELQITQAQFEGRSSDILSSFYARSFDKATYGAALDGVPTAENALHHLRCLIEDRLLSPDGFRESIAFDTIARDLAHAADARTAAVVLEEVVHRRLLTVEERGGVRRIELAHDVLTRIVRASRDERHEAEALARAQAEREQAEAETARMVKERNRLRRLAVVACALAVVAAGGAIFGWIGFRQAVAAKNQAVGSEQAALTAKLQAQKSEQAALAAKSQAEESERNAVAAKNQAVESERQAVTARKRAESGFESAWKGLSDLYDNYAASALENTPGISAKQANALKSQLRVHLLTELRRLHAEQPTHRGTIHYIARLLLDEGYEANSDADYSRALARLNAASQWLAKLTLETEAEADTYVTVLLQHTIATYYVHGDEAGNELAAANLVKVRDVMKRWPDSWRPGYVEIYLEYCVIFDQPQNRELNLRLAERMLPLVAKSGQHFDPAAIYFKLRQDAFWGEGNFSRTASDYALERETIVWFRENIVESKVYNLFQLERAVKRLENLLSFVQTQFSSPNDPSTGEERRAILAELEATVKVLEARLPKSIAVYSVRGVLLRLQEMGLDEGISTRSREELQAAVGRHRLVAAALGVGASVADILAPAFASYTADDADEAAKAAAVSTVKNAMRDFLSLDLAGVDTVLSTSEITSAVDKVSALPPSDPFAALYGQMLDHFIRVYLAAGADAKTTSLTRFASSTDGLLAAWYRNGEYEKVVAFWRASFRDLSIKSLTSGERDTLVRHLNRAACSLLKTGNREEADKLIADTIALCESILTERPWDWYLKNAYMRIGFDTAAVLDELGENAAAQPLLRRAWKVAMTNFGKEGMLERYEVLPLNGQVPEHADPEDAKFFERFVTDAAAKGTGGITRFTIPTDFSGVKFPFHVYVLMGPRGYAELCDQFRWVQEYRGGAIPQEVQESFARLHKIAVENNVDFRDLCVYALGTAAAEEKPAEEKSASQTKALEQFNEALETVQTWQAKYEKSQSDENAQGLAQACNQAAVRALLCERWSEAETFARKAVALAESPIYDANLATALLFGGKYDEALPIYQAHWEERVGRKTLGEMVFADLDTLEKLGLSHPDIARVRSTLSLPTPEQRLEWSLKDVDARLKEYEDDMSEAAKQSLAAAYNMAADRGLYCQRWKDVEAWARKAIALHPTPSCYGNLATALLFQGQYDEALEIYQAHWEEPLNGTTLGQMTLADFQALEKAGVTHPDVARIQAAFPLQSAEPIATDKPAE